MTSNTLTSVVAFDTTKTAVLAAIPYAATTSAVKTVHSIGRRTLAVNRDFQPQAAPPHPLLPNLVLDTPNITFDNGVPVGGNAHLSLFPDGSYSFTGHFHDSGGTSYDTSFVYVVKDVFGVSDFTFSHTGRTHGTFEAGSRDDDWNDYGTNPALAADWGNISSGYNWSSRAGANLNLGGLFDEAVQLVGYAQTVIQVVGNITG